MTADEVLAGLLGPAGLADPYPFYAALHRLGPVSLLPATKSYDVVVNGYAAADRILREPRSRVADETYIAVGVPDWEQHPVLVAMSDSMMFSNDPRHTRMRRLFQQVFTPRRVTGLEPAITALVDSLMARMAAHERVDFMSEFAYLLPSGVVATLLGIPTDDLPWFRPRVERINDFLDVTGTTAEVLAAADKATEELWDYYTEMIASRRADPGNDLVSGLLALEPDLSDRELISNLLVLFNASFVTTIHLLGNGLKLLLDHPELAAALRADPDRATAYVEEMLRFDTSVQFVARFAIEDVELEGVTIPAGAAVLVILGAANRDPVRYDSPDVFEPGRTDSKPLSFGAGPHYCIGAALARAEARLAFPMLLDRFAGLSLDAEPTRNPQQFLRGYSRLPVRL